MAAEQRRLLLGAIALGLLIAATRVLQGVAVAFGIASVLYTRDWSAAAWWAALAVAMVLTRAAAIAIQGGVMAGASVRITTRLRLRLVATILALGPRWLGRERTGELEAVLVDGVERLDAYFRLFLTKVVVAGISALTIVLVIIAIDPVTGIFVAAFAAFVVGLPSLEYRALGSRMRFWSDSYRPLTAEFVDNLQGMTTLKIFGVAAARGHRLRERSAGVRDAAIGLIATSGTYSGMMAFAAAAGVAAALSVAALRYTAGDLGTRQLLLILLLAGECFLPAREIHDAMHSAVWGMAKVERAFAILQVTPALDAAGPVGRPGARPSVTFDDVGFGYLPGRPAVSSLTFSVGAGETIAIVGPSGAGKTTVASLLLRFFDPQHGRILIDGTDIAQMTPDQVRALIALVPQDTFLFHASIRDNLTIVAPQADDADLRAALAAAGAGDFVAALPDDLDTVVGERGLRLSGGERQRIAIARALLKGAPILILDEATSNVDLAAETAIQASLEQLRHGRTTLVIAHRLSTVQHADRIIVLDHGRLIEQGTHADLLRRSGRYASLIAAQATL